MDGGLQAKPYSQMDDTQLDKHYLLCLLYPMSGPNNTYLIVWLVIFWLVAATLVLANNGSEDASSIVDTSDNTASIITIQPTDDLADNNNTMNTQATSNQDTTMNTQTPASTQDPTTLDQPQDNSNQPVDIVQSLIRAMESNDAQTIRSLFAQDASQRYSIAPRKSGDAFRKRLESDIISVQWQVSDPQITAQEDNEVVVTGVYRNNSNYENKANFLFEVENGKIISWTMRY